MAPPLVTLLLAGITAYGAYKWFQQKGGQISKDLKRARDELKRRTEGEPEIKDLGSLKRDPETGEFKPEDQSEKPTGKP